jgi:large subunit ribosomal protein L13
LADLKPEWRLLDADGQVLGRLASRIAQILRGKENPRFVPNLPSGDIVVVVNASKVALTGAKLQNKQYYRHSGYPHGLKQVGLQEMLDKQPTKVIEHAVKGMLPHGPLGRELMRRLKVYAGPEHPHEAQAPLMRQG